MKTGIYWQEPECALGGVYNGPGCILNLPLYQLDGTSFVSGDAYGHPCSVVGAAWTPQGRLFDGSSGVINCGNSEALDITDELSVEVFVNIASVKTSQIVGKMAGGTAGGNYTFGFASAGTKLVMIINDVSFYSSVAHGYSTGEWHHVGVAVSSSNGTIKFYSDGEQLGENITLTQTLTPGTGNLQIGYGGLTYYSGIMDSVRVYNYSRSSVEFRNSYLKDKGGCH